MCLLFFSRLFIFLHLFLTSFFLITLWSTCDGPGRIQLWCFPFWQSNFIKLSDGGLQYEFIWSFFINSMLVYLPNSILVYALQLHLRESKPNLCITLEFCAAPDGSHQLSQEAKLTPCTSVNDWDWTEPLADGSSSKQQSTKPNFNCYCTMCDFHNFGLIFTGQCIGSVALKCITLLV